MLDSVMTASQRKLGPEAGELFDNYLIQVLSKQDPRAFPDASVRQDALVYGLVLMATDPEVRKHLPRGMTDWTPDECRDLLTQLLVDHFFPIMDATDIKKTATRNGLAMMLLRPGIMCSMKHRFWAITRIKLYTATYEEVQR